MAADKIVEGLVAEVLSRLEPEAVWDWAQGCRTVSVESSGAGIRYIVECGADRIGGRMCGRRVEKDLARYIDHTLLKAKMMRRSEPVQSARRLVLILSRLPLALVQGEQPPPTLL